jgi:subtilisin
MRARLTSFLVMAMTVATLAPVFAIGIDPGGASAARNKQKNNSAVVAETRNDRSSANNQQRTLKTGVVTDPGVNEPAGAQLYNVIFKDSVKDPKGEALALGKNEGFKPTHVYSNLFKGFAGKMTPGQARKLERNPKVEAVEPARQLELFNQVTPVGITRVGATVNPVAKIDGKDERVDADVMVIDELVAFHQDLNVVSRADCVDGVVSESKVGGGHGTHVAGTIAALDNGLGVVGVAPGARIWSVNVFQNGGAYDSWIACALDAAAAAKVDVANMSLGGSSSYESLCGGRDVMHNAVCRAVNAGITVVVAAGNSAKDSKGFVPAQYDEVITVSALDDRDGVPSGDRLASFSNFGADVDIAAPGVLVRSTMPNNGYGSMSGTSMASPHVAGAAALYRAQYPTASPAQVQQAIVANREQIALPGDPDGINEGVLDVRNLNSGGTAPEPTPSPTPEPTPSPTPEPAPADTTPPTVALTGPTGTVKRSFTMTATASDASGIARVEFWSCTSAGCAKLGQDTTAPYSLKVTNQPGTYQLYAVAFDTAGNRAESTRTTVIVIKAALKGKAGKADDNDSGKRQDQKRDNEKAKDQGKGKGKRN